MQNSNDTSGSNDIPLEPYNVRITSGGKIHTWVEFALDFFQKNNDRPLVLHTLPALQQVPAQSSEASTAPDQVAVPKESRLSPCTATVPRLISVAEIIKREYLKTLADSHPMQLSGLHQYNEIGCLEDLDLVQTTSHGDRAATLALALEGKNHVRENRTPFMRITLSPKALPELVDKGVSYQLPSVRKLSKSAKARIRKRQRAQESLGN